MKSYIIRIKEKSITLFYFSRYTYYEICNHQPLNLSAVDCGTPTTNLTMQKKTYLTKSEPSATSYSLQIVIVCESGYKFIDDSTQNPSDCGTSGKWSLTPDCSRMWEWCALFFTVERNLETNLLIPKSRFCDEISKTRINYFNAFIFPYMCENFILKLLKFSTS